MEKIEAPKIDKSAWGGGPWQGESDRKEWKDPVTGLPCLIVRNRLGALCGYAGVPDTHPAYGLSYDGIPDADFQRQLADRRKRIKIATKLMDGGADFGSAFSKADEGAAERSEPVGVGTEVRDVSVHGGLTYSGACNGHICHTPEEGEPDNIWWFGFDCAHAFDLVPGMDYRYRAMGLGSLLEGGPYDDVYRDMMTYTAIYRMWNLKSPLWLASFPE